MGLSNGAGAHYLRPMLRLTELKLPLDHGEEALKRAILRRLAIQPGALKNYTIFRRGHDARFAALDGDAVRHVHALTVEA